MNDNERDCDLTREQWTVEVRRLLREKYAVEWPAGELTRYAEALAETFWEDGKPSESPDAAIYEDFTAGL